MTESATRPARAAILGALVGMAVLVGAAVTHGSEDVAVAPAAILAGLGIAARLVEGRRRSMIPLHLAFVGLAALLFSPLAATAVAGTVGLAGFAQRDLRERILLTTGALVAASGAVAWFTDLGDELFADQRTISAVTEFGPEVAVRPSTVLAATGVLAVALIGVRALGGAFDRRLQIRRPPVETERWIIDVALAALAGIGAMLWAVSPPLVLLAGIVLAATAAILTTDASSALDELTGVGAPAMLRVALAEELARSAEFDRPLSVLLVDIDDLAAVNARYGFRAGDLVVWTVAERVRAIARDYDIVARVSADAFAVLLPESDPDGAHVLAERIRAAVAEDPVRVETATAPIPLTVSIGIASFPSDADDRQQLLTEAELAATYAALQGGDRITHASRLPEGFHPVVGTSRAGRRVLGRAAGSASTGNLSGDPNAARPESTEMLAATPIVRGDDAESLVRAAQEPLEVAKPRTDRLLSLVALLAVISTVVAVVLEPGIDDWGRLALFGLVAAGAEWFAESIYGRANSSWAAVPLIALATFSEVTPAAVVIAAVMTAAIGGSLRGVRLRQGLFNGAVLVLSVLAAWAAVRPIWLWVDDLSLLDSAGLGMLSGGAFFVVDTWLVATAVAVASQAKVAELWREDLLWLVPYQLGMGVLGGAMAFAYVSFGTTGLLLLAVPAVGLHLAQRQFLTRTREHVVRLRSLADDMRDANRRYVAVNERLTEALDQVNQGYLVTVESLAAAVDAKDSYTGSHIDRVEEYGRRLLEVLDPSLTEDEALLWGFRLHDVGKIGVPDAVLRKPGPLDDDEWELMKRHPEIGAQIVAAAPFLQGARDVILHHHERWDGRGYPHGLAGAAIPFSARVFTVIDAYDAMTSDRPYREGLPIEQALEELIRHAGAQFDPETVEAFLQIGEDELIRIRDGVEERRDARWTRSGGLLIPIAPEYQQDLQPSQARLAPRGT